MGYPSLLMIRRRTRDSGFGHHHNDLFVFIIIVGILAAIAIPQFIKLMDKRATTCLGNILAQADGPLPKETVCPFSKKAYGGGDVPSCPEPAKHLESNPRMVRPKDGPPRLEQTLPAYAGGPIELKNGRIEVQTHPGRAAVLVLPAKFARYFGGPVLLTLFGVWALVAAARFAWGLWKKNWESAILNFLGLAFAGGISTWLIMGFATSHEWVVERSGARVTRVEYLFGSRRSEHTLANCLAIVPAKAVGGHRLLIVHPPGPDGNRFTPMEMIPEDRLDLADWFNRALAGP